MDDVIFSGTNSRPARNNAEVAMLVDNADRSAPAAFNDPDSIDIARRIEREAGSTYRINGKEVRARDVQLLFADASTGARSPALVHQGHIGEIIQAKPEQRRRVLEEAAGISGLHARRHEAELRLKAAEANLLRARGRDRPARRPDRRPEEAGAAGDPLPHVSGAGAQGGGDALSSALDRGQRRGRRGRARQGPRVREVADRTGAQAEASTRAGAAHAALPDLREAEARAAAALHRLNRRAARRSTARKRAPRTASPSSTGGSSSSPPTASASSAGGRCRSGAGAARRRGRGRIRTGGP